MNLPIRLSEESTLEPDYLHRLLDEGAAAAFLGYSRRALQNWRTRGGGPPYVKVSSRSVRYRRRELIKWSDSRITAHSSDLNSS